MTAGRTQSSRSSSSGKRCGWIDRFQQGSASGGFEHSHQDAGLQAVPCYIGNVGDITVLRGNHVHEIAADAFTGPGDPIDLIKVAGTGHSRHEGLLNAMSQFKLVLDAEGFGRLLADERDEVDIGEHEQCPYAGSGHAEGCQRAWHMVYPTGVGKPCQAASKEAVKDANQPDPWTWTTDQQPWIENRIRSVGNAHCNDQQERKASRPHQIYVEAVDGEQEEDGEIEPKKAAAWQVAERRP